MYKCGQEDAMCACGVQRTAFRSLFSPVGAWGAKWACQIFQKALLPAKLSLLPEEKIVIMCFITFLFIHLNVAGAHIGVMWWPEDTFWESVLSFHNVSSGLNSDPKTWWQEPLPTEPSYQSRRSFLTGVLCLIQGLTYVAQARLFINFSALTSLVLLGLQL